MYPLTVTAESCYSFRFLVEFPNRNLYHILALLLNVLKTIVFKKLLQDKAFSFLQQQRSSIIHFITNLKVVSIYLIEAKRAADMSLFFLKFPVYQCASNKNRNRP